MKDKTEKLKKEIRRRKKAEAERDKAIARLELLKRGLDGDPKDIEELSLQLDALDKKEARLLELETRLEAWRVELQQQDQVLSKKEEFLGVVEGDKAFKKLRRRLNERGQELSVAKKSLRELTTLVIQIDKDRSFFKNYHDKHSLLRAETAEKAA